MKSTTEGADLFLYLNTSSEGSVLSKSWGIPAHTLPFEANHGFVLEDETYFRHISYNGISGQENTVIEIYTGWESNQITEISIPWGALRNPNSFI